MISKDVKKIIIYIIVLFISHGVFFLAGILFTAGQVAKFKKSASEIRKQYTKSKQRIDDLEVGIQDSERTVVELGNIIDREREIKNGLRNVNIELRDTNRKQKEINANIKKSVGNIESATGRVAELGKSNEKLIREATNIFASETFRR